MKNIVFVIESLHLGGAEKSLVTLLHNLDYQQYNVDLILFTNEGIFLNQVPSQVNIIQIKWPHFTFLKRIYYKVLRAVNYSNLHNAQILWPLIENNFTVIDKRYDAAIAYSQGFSTYYVAKFISATKNFSWLNTNYQKTAYNIKFDYSFYKNYDKIVAVSVEAKNSLEKELYKIKKEIPIVIIKDITDQMSLQKLATVKPDIVFKSNKINVVTVCRLAKEKGLPLAINACRHLLDSGYEINWYVVGEGGEREYLEKLIIDNNLSDSFFLLGATNNPYPYMKAADIYVQTSLFEGLGLTVIEASYLNKPIVATNFDTVYSIIENEETGLIAEMTPDSIALQVKRLVVDKTLRTKFINNLAKQENKDKEESLQKINELLLI